MGKLFPKFMIATKAMALCCEPDGELPSPVAGSEVYNETWMLRLTLALIHDFDGEFVGLPEREKMALENIRRAVRVKWVSEGGLEPAFEKEGTTWTDAILGNISLRGDSKRGIYAELKQEDAGVVIVEAKMGSELSSGVTNSANYDQAARNIACLSRLLLKNPELVSNSCFCVFTPDVNGKVAAAEAFVRNAEATIRNETRRYREEISNVSRFSEIVKEIADRSTVISWDRIISSMGLCDGIEELKAYYMRAKAEMPKGVDF